MAVKIGNPQEIWWLIALGVTDIVSAASFKIVNRAQPSKARRVQSGPVFMLDSFRIQ